MHRNIGGYIVLTHMLVAFMVLTYLRVALYVTYDIEHFNNMSFALLCLLVEVMSMQMESLARVVFKDVLNSLYHDCN